MTYARMAHSLLRRHPLQRLSSPSRSESALLHIAGLASFTYSFTYLILNPNPINYSYGWHLQYLTIIGLALAALTFTVALLADLTLSHRLFWLKNHLSVASAPMECLITMLYWGLRAIDPALVLPDFSPHLDRFTDLSFHTAPSFFLVTDLLFFSPPYTVTFLPALALSGCIAFGYWFWVEWCYRFNKFYPYPIFALLSTPQRIGLFAASAVLMALSTGCLQCVYAVVNGKRMSELEGGDGQRWRKERGGNVRGEM